MVTFTGPASASSTSSNIAFLTTLGPQAPPTGSPQSSEGGGSSFFSSGSLLFGFIFLAVFISFMSCGLVWQRAARRRRGGERVLYLASDYDHRPLEKPELWDVYLGPKGGHWRAESESWRDIKPLTVQPMPSDSATSTKHSTERVSMSDNGRDRQSPSDLRAATHGGGRYAASRAFRSLLVHMRPAQPNQNTRPTGANSTDSAERQSPSANAHTAEQLQVAVVIAMPDPQHPVGVDGGRDADGPAADKAKEAMHAKSAGLADEDDAECTEELVYELGVAQVRLRDRAADGEDSCTKL